jgi:transcriptional regulator with XRE-family HTH domain
MRRADVATEAGISYTHLSEIENGKKEPSSRTLTAIAGALGLRPSDVVRRADLLYEGNQVKGPAPAAWLDAAPMAAAEPAPKGGWFHERTMPAMQARAADESRMRPRDLLTELLELARGLPPEDLQRLVDLARRFHQQLGGPMAGPRES